MELRIKENARNLDTIFVHVGSSLRICHQNLIAEFLRSLKIEENLVPDPIITFCQVKPCAATKCP